MRRYRISRRCVCSDARDLRRFRAGTVKTMANAKVIVFNVEVEATATENKGTVLIESSDQLMNYNRSEEIAMEAVRCTRCTLLNCRLIAAAGADDQEHR